MKHLAIVVAVLLLAGCASFEEAYYTDREFGQASQHAWDSQVVYPDLRYAKEIPTGLEGITAEQIMDIHTKAFAEKPQKVDIFNFGVTE